MIFLTFYGSSCQALNCRSVCQHEVPPPRFQNLVQDERVLRPLVQFLLVVSLLMPNLVFLLAQKNFVTPILKYILIHPRVFFLGGGSNAWLVKHATCPTHPIRLDFITRTIFGDQYRSLSSSLCSFRHSPVTPSLLGPNIPLNTLFSNTLSSGAN